jgi:predicted Zn-dependent peptidase
MGQHYYGRSLGMIDYLRRAIALGLSLLLTISSWGISPVLAQEQQGANTFNLQQVIDQVTEFQLDNGMDFIVLEDHSAPVVSFVTYADVGGVDEPEGKTGVAHFLEHLAFKGTSKIGTRDYTTEKELLSQLDRLSRKLKLAQAIGDEEQAQTVAAEFSQMEQEANGIAIQNEFGQIVETAGGVGLNAATSADYTMYFYNFPANKLELWMSLESNRYLDPVFREFFKEQQVILEERRLRTDNSPIGQMVEAFLDKAFTTHPYRRPVIGYSDDISNLTRQDVQQFFSTYYTPENITIAIVGDVQPNQVKKLARTYFGRLVSKGEPPQVTTVEPPQTTMKEVDLELNSEPWYLEGYHRPALNHPDNSTYEIIAALMSNGRTSRLYKSLVQEQQVALTAEGINGFPGEKYPNLLLFYAMTSPTSSLDEVSKSLHSEIQRLVDEPISEIELDRVKTNAKASLIRTLDSKQGMAKLLVEYEVKTGDWRNLFNQLTAIEAVTVEDIQRVARATFTPENMTIGKIIKSGSTQP